MTKEWKDGLPPVGCECKFNPTDDQDWDVSKWIPVTIVAHHNSKAIFCDDFSRHYYAESEGFHPIKSKQDLEREGKIVGLSEVFASYRLYTNADYAKVAINEGYRNNGEEVDMERFFWICDALLKSRNASRLDFKNQIKADFKIYPRNP